MTKQVSFFLLLLFSYLNSTATTSISINGDKAYWDNPITATTLDDVKALLQQSFICPVEFNNTKADVILQLPALSELNPNLKSRAGEGHDYPYFSYPLHNYGWERSGANQIFKLSATSYQGVSFGLYGLLQEKLGFAFYHPRETYIPNHGSRWPIETILYWEAKPVFDKKGFHLHTQHPLELTEPLLDQDFPGALNSVKEYINWLVRNGQNYFEFCLLENIDRKKWPTHAKAFVDYAHSRGILVGVDFSLHMIQQKTFQMYLSPTQSLQSKEKQVLKNLEWLMQIDWDLLNMEFASAEFVGGNRSKKEALRLKMIAWLSEHKPSTKLMGRQHIVKHDNEQVVTGKKEFQWDSTSTALDRKRGIMAHTVMFYDMTEENAPVYQNKNQRHQFEFLKEQLKIRETWYYPESAYWVTFDNSVPMLLLPYLTARLNDIDTCEAYQVPGHLTFSSGWEWGYWLIDWSIARWSWNQWENGNKLAYSAAMYINGLNANYKASKGSIFDATKVLPLNSGSTYSEIEYILFQQSHFLKVENLIKWLTAMSITDELPKGMNNEFHPRPPISYKYLQRKASIAEITKIRSTVWRKLYEFATKSRDINLYTSRINPPIWKYRVDTTLTFWQNDLRDGYTMTNFRALHRYYTLDYILAKRSAKINHKPCNCDSLLDKAVAVRQQAQLIVNEREKHYRYPLSSIASKLKGHTSYDFGYLYPVHSLQFWYREEEQARHNRYGPLYKTLFNPFKIIGLVD